MKVKMEVETSHRSTVQMTVVRDEIVPVWTMGGIYSGDMYCDACHTKIGLDKKVHVFEVKFQRRNLYMHLQCAKDRLVLDKNDESGGTDGHTVSCDR
jgi:hypothetical protein